MTIIFIDFEAYFQNATDQVPSEIALVRYKNHVIQATFHCFYQPDKEEWQKMYQTNASTINHVFELTGIYLPFSEESKSLFPVYSGDLSQLGQTIEQFCKGSSSVLQQLDFTTLYASFESADDYQLVAKGVHLEQAILARKMKTDLYQRVVEAEQLNKVVNKTFLNTKNIHSQREFYYCPCHTKLKTKDGQHCALDDCLFLCKTIFQCSFSMSSTLMLQTIQEIPTIILTSQRKAVVEQGVKILQKFMKDKSVFVFEFNEQKREFAAAAKLIQNFEKFQLEKHCGNCKIRMLYIDFTPHEYEQMNYKFDFTAELKKKSLTEILKSFQLSQPFQCRDFTMLHCTYFVLDPLVLCEVCLMRIIKNEKVAELHILLEPTPELRIQLLTQKINLVKEEKFLQVQIANVQDKDRFMKMKYSCLGDIIDRFCLEGSRQMPQQSIIYNDFEKIEPHKVQIALIEDFQPIQYILQQIGCRYYQKCVELSKLNYINNKTHYKYVQFNDRCWYHQNKQKGYCVRNVMEGIRKQFSFETSE
uniref:Uncharacterized protein n=1 Tax=Trepomonas sp. PC1 TaxID=1076344 RepID=A0A146KJA8_9EUKA|eukprot:JAP95521.1 Hypothetical protein TPC1_11465 [Trepomonas sp. PC1]